MESFLAVGIDDTGKHFICMQIDPALKLVLNLMQVHHASPWRGGEPFYSQFNFFRSNESIITDEHTGCDLFGETAHPWGP